MCIAKKSDNMLKGFLQFGFSRPTECALLLYCVVKKTNQCCGSSTQSCTASSWFFWYDMHQVRSICAKSLRSTWIRFFHRYQVVDGRKNSKSAEIFQNKFLLMLILIKRCLLKYNEADEDADVLIVTTVSFQCSKFDAVMVVGEDFWICWYRQFHLKAIFSFLDPRAARWLINVNRRKVSYILPFH